MSRTIYTYENHNLGDQLIFLHLLRALAKAHVSTPFVHFCNGCHMPQLTEVVSDIPNIILEPFESPLWAQRQHSALCVWKNHEAHWEKSPVRWDWSAHALEHHRWTARRMGFESPFSIREHLLFDWMPDNQGPFEYDFYIVDAEPSSGQFSPMKEHGSGYMNKLIASLREKYSVATSSEALATRCSISDIAVGSQRCKHHIMIATGPMWPTLNVHNHHNQAGRKRIVLLDNGERLEMPGIIQCANVEEVMQIARQEGWL